MKKNVLRLRLDWPGKFFSCLLLAGLSVTQLLAQNPPGATVSTKITVPASMTSAPFNVDRFANVPPDFSLSVYARVPKARFMAVAPNGDLLVSQPSTGNIVLVRPNANGDPLVSNFVTGLKNPHDMVFHVIGTVTYLYVSESHQINRYIYNSGDQTAHDRQIVVAGLPDNSTPELNGAYSHALKNIALDGNHKLYVSIASTCNACLSDTQSDPIRGAIYQYNADGTGRRLFAKGLRNAEGLAFIPGTNTLWVAVNNRDNIAYPFNDNTGNYGKIIPGYVDNHPPEEFTQVRDGGNYGWPFCNPNPDNGLDNMPFDLDFEFNADGHVNPATMDRISKGIQAHSAPLGMSFLQGTNFPAAYRNGAVLGLHGSWNRQQKTGYKVIYFPWNTTTQMPGNQIDLVTGFLNDATQEVVGRPVDALVDNQGNLLISDDYSGTIYKLSASITLPPIVHAIPGVVEAEVYNQGGEGVAYHDADPTNKSGAFRNEGVDIEVCSEGGHNLDWSVTGEWVQYTVNVANTGSYKIDTRVASPSSGGSFHIEFDGVNVTGAIPVPNTGGWQNWQTVSKTVNLTAGQYVMRFFIDQQEFNTNKFTFTSLAPIGDGLTAQYFNGQNFNTSVLTRKDANINFNWGDGSPAAGVNVDSYSVRWTGQILPRNTGTYTFHITSDNGRRVWVNNVLIIDKWVDDWDITYTGTINLTAGQKVNIKVEYFENWGGANAKLEWSGAGQAREVIPQSQLFSTAAARLAEVEKTDAPSLKLSPNPASESVNVTWEGIDESAVKLSVVNAQGKRVHELVIKGRSSHLLNTAQWGNGLYVVRVQAGALTVTKKLLIKH